MNTKTGMVEGFNTFSPLPDLNAMRERLPQFIVEFFLQNKSIPAMVHYIPSFAMNYILPILHDLHIRVIEKKRLPHFEEAWEMMDRDPIGHAL
jgi:hypothetical protein